MRIVEGVKELGPKLRRERFNLECLEARQIEAHDARTPQRSVLGVPESLGRWIRETACVEPLVDALRVVDAGAGHVGSVADAKIQRVVVGPD
jgi:hypothetical protein